MLPSILACLLLLITLICLEGVIYMEKFSHFSELSQNLAKLSHFHEISYPVHSKPISSVTPPRKINFCVLLQHSFSITSKPLYLYTVTNTCEAVPCP